MRKESSQDISSEWEWLVAEPPPKKKDTSETSSSQVEKCEDSTSITARAWGDPFELSVPSYPWPAWVPFDGTGNIGYSQDLISPDNAYMFHEFP